MTIIKDLISQIDIADVLEMITLHYGVQNIDTCNLLLNKLNSLKENKNSERMTVYIDVYYDENKPAKNFDEYDSSLFFEVYALTPYDSSLYSIASSSYADFLGFYIAKETLEKMSKVSIIAHCLWEITSYSFEDNI